MKICSYTETIHLDNDQYPSDEVFFGHRIAGRVLAIKYERGTIPPGSGFNLIGEKSEHLILSIPGTTGNPDSTASGTIWWYPRVRPSQVLGGDDFWDELTDVYVFNERIRLRIAGGIVGQNTKGSMTIYTEEV
jgi:hypothetical protein